MEAQHPGVRAPPGRRAVDAAAAAEPVEPPEQGVTTAVAGAMYMRVQRVSRRHLRVHAAGGRRHGVAAPVDPDCSDARVTLRPGPRRGVRLPP